MQLHLDSYGARLRVKDGLLEVRYAKDGVVQVQRFSALHVDTIFLRKGTSVSSDAILLAMEHDVTILITNSRGFPVGRFYPHTPNSTTLIQKAQLMMSIQPQGMEYARTWIAQKLESQEALITRLLNYRSTKDRAMYQSKLERMAQLRQKLLVMPASAASFRGIEGSAVRIFYYLLGQFLPKRYSFARRSRRPAQDAFNAFLNYAYALLYVRVEEALLEAGLNPYIGFMHRDHYQYKGLVYDFIEPFRTETVAVVYRLFTRKKVSDKHTDQQAGNGVWLNLAGKQLLVPALKKAYEDKHKLRDHIRLTEAQYIRRRASHFAQLLLQYIEADPILIVEPTNGHRHVHLGHV